MALLYAPRTPAQSPRRYASLPRWRNVVRLDDGPRLRLRLGLRRVLLRAARSPRRCAAPRHPPPPHATCARPARVALRLRPRRRPRRAHGFLRRHELQFQLDVLQLARRRPISNSASIRRRASASSSSMLVVDAGLVQIEALALRILPATLARFALFVEAQARHLGGQVEIIVALRVLSVLVEIDASSTSSHRRRRPPRRTSRASAGRRSGTRRATTVFAARSRSPEGTLRAANDAGPDHAILLGASRASTGRSVSHESSAPKPLAAMLHAASLWRASLGCSDNNGSNRPRVLGFQNRHALRATTSTGDLHLAVTVPQRERARGGEEDHAPRDHHRAGGSVRQSDRMPFLGARAEGARGVQHQARGTTRP